jgi:hypothetical protein
VLRKPQLIGQMREAPGVLVTTVEQQNRAFRSIRGRRPVAIEQLDTIMRAKRTFFDPTHGEPL